MEDLGMAVLKQPLRRVKVSMESPAQANLDVLLECGHVLRISTFERVVEPWREKLLADGLYACQACGKLSIEGPA
jgi:hypothetical protein